MPVVYAWYTGGRSLKPSAKKPTASAAIAELKVIKEMNMSFEKAAAYLKTQSGTYHCARNLIRDGRTGSSSHQGDAREIAKTSLF